MEIRQHSLIMDTSSALRLPSGRLLSWRQRFWLSSSQPISREADARQDIEYGYYIAPSLADAWRCCGISSPFSIIAIRSRRQSGFLSFVDATSFLALEESPSAYAQQAVAKPKRHSNSTPPPTYIITRTRNCRRVARHA